MYFLLIFLVKSPFFLFDGTEPPFCVSLTPSYSGFGGSDLGPFNSDSVYLESIVPEYELDSMVPETPFEEPSSPLFNWEDAERRRISGGGYGGATSGWRRRFRRRNGAPMETICCAC